MSTFFRGITESIPSLFREIFSERNSVANPIPCTSFSPSLSCHGAAKEEVAVWFNAMVAVMLFCPFVRTVATVSKNLLQQGRCYEGAATKRCILQRLHYRTLFA
jgi:hypothetical protein